VCLHACVITVGMYCLIIPLHRMGDVVEECGELQRKVELLESQLKQLQDEYTTLQNISISSPESYPVSSQKPSNKQSPSFLTSKLGSTLSGEAVGVKTPKVLNFFNEIISITINFTDFSLSIFASVLSSDHN